MPPGMPRSPGMSGQITPSEFLNNAVISTS
jgi:hypothetical protein